MWIGTETYGVHQLFPTLGPVMWYWVAEAGREYANGQQILIGINIEILI